MPSPRPRIVSTTQAAPTGLLHDLEAAYAAARRTEDAESKGCRGPLAAVLRKQAEAAGVLLESVEEQIAATRAISVEDAALQVLLALDFIDRMRDHEPTEEYVAELGGKALRLLFSAVGALRRMGALKTSDELDARIAPDWRSPWLTVEEADAAHARVCGPNRCKVTATSPSRTYFGLQVAAIPNNTRPAPAIVAAAE